ncbi:MAG: tRNA uridine(34) 5-carboxymethylaminomethyl modification radical SAM/GNAT enzyme Elp3, partial [Chloroflexi bacterium]|nr:tRNA uridine(34) 5-carboxymethylaminomethyl modification radical SAM/GNAT enzyme Elp3 [Chloroflexota bacterium]
EVRALPRFSSGDFSRILRRHPRPGAGAFGRDFLIAEYRRLCAEGRLAFDRETLRRLQLKPTRTISGVATVTVLTKPYPCPGKCIFCPTDVRMPKSYLHDEPGALRAEFHQFDPFDQTAARLRALGNVGHNTAKVELLILGGTWSAYRRDYREWFVKRCFDAMNGREAASLAEAQRWNETAARRNVGLVIETRPDHIDPDEIAHLRYLGVTKVQLGAQSLDDQILDLNKRGHTVEQTRQAVGLLRAAGFKIHLHWMPNLLGATPDSDRADFLRLWSDPALRPDELKIYPCSLLQNAELYEYWLRGEYQPYSDDEITELLIDCKLQIPRYCRVNRVIRDIPAGHIVAGLKRSNLREDVQREMKLRGLRCQCIRCREVRGDAVDPATLHMESEVYDGGGSEEHFLSFVTPDDRLAGYLRLSLPVSLTPALSQGEREIISPLSSGEGQRARAVDSPLLLGEGQGVRDDVLPELRDAALIREVHVYGPALELGVEQGGAAQHIGLGTRLLEAAEEIARGRGFGKMAVIAAIGAREYYRSRGYALGETYMLKEFKGG